MLPNLHQYMMLPGFFCCIFFQIIKCKSNCPQYLLLQKKSSVFLKHIKHATTTPTTTIKDNIRILNKYCSPGSAFANFLHNNTLAKKNKNKLTTTIKYCLFQACTSNTCSSTVLCSYLCQVPQPLQKTS